MPSERKEWSGDVVREDLRMDSPLSWFRTAHNPWPAGAQNIRPWRFPKFVASHATSGRLRCPQDSRTFGQRGPLEVDRVERFRGRFELPHLGHPTLRGSLWLSAII